MIDTPRPPCEQAIARFWNWVAAHEAQLFAVEYGHSPLLDEFLETLRAVDADLTFEFGPVCDGKRELVLSADGHQRAFPSVMRLCAEQPVLSKLDIIPFRPRQPVAFDIELQGLRVSADRVHYHLCEDTEPGKIGVLLFIEGYEDERRREFCQIGFLFLDHALGEYDVEMSVGFIDIQGFDSPHYEGSHPLVELPRHFDQLRRPGDDA